MLKLRKRYPICYPNIIIDGKERTEDAMEKDMKKQIAEASRELLFEDQVKKLTVKAIVDKCKITRQAFYYHFEDMAYEEVENIIRDLKKDLKRMSEASSLDEFDAEKAALLAEYMMDFAMQTSDYALLSVMKANDAQLRLEEKEA